MTVHETRSRLFPLRLVAAAALLAGATPASAVDLRPDGAGVEVDLLPVAASALAREAGGSLQAWAGVGRNRLRLVGAHLHHPNGLTAAPFADRSTTVAALIYDRFFREGFAGPWVAAGAEYWWSEVGLRGGAARGSWSTPVATVGAGWVFPMWKGLYLNPWAAAHVPFSTRSVTVGTESYGPRALEAEVSLKLGWRWALRRA